MRGPLLAWRHGRAEYCAYVRSGGAWKRQWREGDIAAGIASVTADANGLATMSFGRTLPGVPVVTANAAVSTSSLNFVVSIIQGSATATSVKVRLYQPNGTVATGNRGIYWQAVVP